MAHAQASASVELEWHAPADCPSAREVLQRIDALAGPDSVAATPLRAQATIAQGSSGRLQLRLLVRAGGLAGERVIEGKSCDDLAGAAAVNLVLLLQSGQPLSAAEQRAHESSRGTDSLPAARARASSASLEAAARSNATEQDDGGSGRSSRVVLQLPRVTSNLGLLPKPSLGVALGVGLSFGRALVLAEGGVWFPQRWLSTQRPDSGASVNRIDAGLRGCWVFAVEWLELAPCVAVSLEHLWARGEGARIAPRTAATSWVAAGLGGRARVQLTAWLGLVVTAEAQVGLARPYISIEGLGRVGQLAPLAIELGLGTEWIL